MKTQRITKKHVGRPMDFYGCNADESNVCHGRIVSVKSGIAKLEDCIFPAARFQTGGYTAFIEVNSKKIIAIY